MANIKSARKRARQAGGRRARNVSQHTAARSAIKDVRKAIATGDKKAAVAARGPSQAVSTALPGHRHRNAAARQKSRLAHAIKAMA